MAKEGAASPGHVAREGGARGSAPLIGLEPGCAEVLGVGVGLQPDSHGTLGRESGSCEGLRGLSSSSLSPTLGSEGHNSITSGCLLAPTVYFVTLGKFLL